ncbi:MAG: hypothetical protein KAS91_00845 [Candidatus Pacebacteria bacterium]|nr:hypothetical protein [Candidatus Paceibacterota bacterium]
MTKSIILTFWALIGVFLLIASQFFIPVVRELARGSIIFLLPFIIFSLLGIILIFLALKQEVKGALKRFLILTGISATGFFIFVFLHNMFYGLGVITNQIPILSFVMEILGITCFIIAIFICPLGFVIGAGGSIIMFINKKRKSIVF